MFRLIPAIGLMFALTAPAALAADYPDALRGGFPADWDMSDEGDPLGFEVGIRYYYSMGSVDMNLAGGSYSINDASHAFEIHTRIDDYSTGTYLKTYAGYAGLVYGDQSTPATAGVVNISNGYNGYLLADFGSLGFGDGSFTYGPFAGYQYVTTSSSTGVPSETINIDYHMIRLGLAARAELGETVDLSAEVALIPYTFVTGSVSTGATIDTALMGLTAELMLGFHPTDDITIRAGGRGWYLTNTFGGGGTSSFTSLRGGGLVELTHAF